MPPKISIAALAALENAGINPQTSQIVGGSSGGFPSTSTFNPPQELYSLDQILINGVLLPLAEMPKTSLMLDTDEKKSPGSDFKTYTSKGLEQKPIEIKLLLFRDAWTRKDWFAEWARISQLIPAKKLDKRNGISVFHPVLAEIGIGSILFTERGAIVRERGQIFSVTLRGLDPKRIKIGGGSKKAVPKVDPIRARGPNGNLITAAEFFTQSLVAQSKPPGDNLSKTNIYPGNVVFPQKTEEPIQSVPPGNQSLEKRLPSIYRK
jgi:hypothetical protein